MILIKIDDAELQRRLRGLLEALDDSHLAKVLGDIGQNLVEGTRSRITKSEDWTGASFAANRDVTLARKRGLRPLIDSGTFVSHRLFHRVAGHSVEIGANAIQAAVLQFGARKGQFGNTKRGAPIPWGNIPARAYFPLAGRSNTLVPAAREEVHTTIEEYLAAAGR